MVSSLGLIMKRTSETIAFFGSGPVAAASLELLARSFSIEVVITKPSAGKHEGLAPVLDIAERLAIPTYTAINKQELSELFTHFSPQSRVAVLIDYGIIIQEPVIKAFPLGIVNSHFSLLPQWRGPDPISFAILSGQATTGVSLMLIVPELDEGPLLAQQSLAIPDGITGPELTRRLVELSNTMLQQTLPAYLQGMVHAKPQSTDEPPTYSRKLTKTDGLIDWTKPAEQLEREIRAFIEWPKSRTMIGGKEVVLTAARVVKKQGNAGTIHTDKHRLIVVCGRDALEILRLKPAGKKEMTAEAFLAGYGKTIISSD